MEYILHKKSNCKRKKIRVVKGVVCVSAPLNVSTRERLKDNLGDFAMNISTMLILDILYVSIFNTDYSKHVERRKSSSQGFDLFRTSHNPKIK